MEVENWAETSKSVLMDMKHDVDDAKTIIKIKLNVLKSEANILEQKAKLLEVTTLQYDLFLKEISIFELQREELNTRQIHQFKEKFQLFLEESLETLIQNKDCSPSTYANYVSSRNLDKIMKAKNTVDLKESGKLLLDNFSDSDEDLMRAIRAGFDKLNAKDSTTFDKHENSEKSTQSTASRQRIKEKRMARLKLRKKRSTPTQKAPRPFLGNNEQERTQLREDGIKNLLIGDNQPESCEKWKTQVLDNMDPSFLSSKKQVATQNESEKQIFQNRLAKIIDKQPSVSLDANKFSFSASEKK